MDCPLTPHPLTLLYLISLNHDWSVRGVGNKILRWKMNLAKMEWLMDLEGLIYAGTCVYLRPLSQISKAYSRLTCRVNVTQAARSIRRRVFFLLCPPSWNWNHYLCTHSPILLLQIALGALATQDLVRSGPHLSARGWSAHQDKESPSHERHSFSISIFFPWEEDC